MTIYKNVKVIKTEKVYPDLEERELPIECWATFRINDYTEIETFMMPWSTQSGDTIITKDLKKFPDEGDIVNVDLSIMAYDLYRINIEEKMLKQITKFPGEDKYGRSWPSIPMYFVMGEIKEKEKFYKEYRGKKIPSARMKVDCGILLDVVKINCSQVDELFEGDHVALIGMMYGEIVKDGDKIDIQAKSE